MIKVITLDFRELSLMIIEAVFIVTLYNCFDNKKRTLARNISAIVLMVITEVIQGMINSDINLFINFCLITSVFIIAFKEKTDEAILKISLTVVLANLLQLVIVLILIIFKVKFVVNDPRYFGVDLAANVSTLIMVIAIHMYVPIYKFYFAYTDQIRKIFIFVINVVFFILALRTLLESNKSYFMSHIAYFSIMPIIIIAINLIFYFYYTRNREEKKAQETYNQYSPVMSNLIEDVRRRQHDFRNHLTTIYGLAQVSKGEQLSEKIKNYINSLTYSLEDYSYLIEINNKVMAAIIYNKICEAKDKNLRFLYEIHSDVHIPLQDFEVSEILNNLLDNAFRAAQEADTLNKEVSLEVGNDEGVDFIEVRNSVNKNSIKNIDKFSDRGFTTKKSSGHGYGLYNVKKAAEQNNGKVKISVEDEFITIKVEFLRNAAELKPEA